MTFDANDPEVKAAIAAAVEEATTGLVEKNKELVGKLNKAKRGAEIDPAEHQALADQVDKLTGELAAAQKQAKDATKAAETAAKQLADESGFTQRLLIDNGLVGELTKHGVTNAVHLKAAQAMLRGSVQIVADGENRIAKVGDKALGDYVKEWAAGDEGKHFVTAAQNGGGGALGGAAAVTGAEAMKLSPTARMDAGRATKT
jgi:ABC-type transporter Mla subunit MlaD